MGTLKAPTAIICLSPNSGGMEIDAIKLANKLTPYTKVVLIAQKDCFIAESVTATKDSAITLETIKFSSNLGLSIIFNARNIIQKHKIKNVIFFGASELKSLYFSFLGLDINLIVRHGTTKSRAKKDWFHRLIYSNVNYHVSICQHLLVNVRKIIPFGKDTQERLIYSSFNFSEPQHRPQEKLTLLHIGRIAPAKGQLDAIQACEVLVENNIDFIFKIVGAFEESYKDEFMKYYNSCSYKDKIELVGFKEDIVPFLEEADIFLFPSHGEGLSNAFLEALSFNLVAISYNNTSFPELQELGLYFNMVGHLNLNLLKERLLEVVDKLDREKHLSQKNHNLIKTLFSVEKEMKNYLKILE